MYSNCLCAHKKPRGRQLFHGYSSKKKAQITYTQDSTNNLAMPTLPPYIYYSSSTTEFQMLYKGDSQDLHILTRPTTPYLQLRHVPPMTLIRQHSSRHCSSSPHTAFQHPTLHVSNWSKRFKLYCLRCFKQVLHVHRKSSLPPPYSTCEDTLK